MKGSDLLVAALENEGVDRIFGVPGEENLDVVESLRRSSIELVVTRHEQPAAFLAATYGRLTGKPGVALSTLGPGALNFVTGAAYGFLGGMPMVLITGQKAIRQSRQAHFQIVDVVAAMRPLTKQSQQIVSASSIPTLVRNAFRVAAEERPGPVHLELPEDVAAEEAGDVPLVPAHAAELPVPSPEAVKRASDLILAAKFPLLMFGAGASRPQLAPALSDFVRRVRIPFFNTQMGKGAVGGASDFYLGTAALSERDYVHKVIDRADLIVTIGHETVEKPPFLMSQGRHQVIHVGFVSATVEEVYFPQAEVIGEIAKGPRSARRPVGRQAEDESGLGRSARGYSGSHHRSCGRGSLPPHSATHRARRPTSHAARRHRGARQRDVQDLVRAQLPHRCCKHLSWRRSSRMDKSQSRRRRRTSGKGC
jgi:acetolactate synthase I/II/III large subunit